MHFIGIYELSYYSDKTKFVNYKIFDCTFIIYNLLFCAILS